MRERALGSEKVGMTETDCETLSGAAYKEAAARTPGLCGLQAECARAQNDVTLRRLRPPTGAELGRGTTTWRHFHHCLRRSEPAQELWEEQSLRGALHAPLLSWRAPHRWRTYTRAAREIAACG